jgi:hypothetical protein
MPRAEVRTYSDLYAGLAEDTFTLTTLSAQAIQGDLIAHEVRYSRSNG